MRILRPLCVGMAVGVSTIFLSGCFLTPAQMEQRNNLIDHQKCLSYGARPHTDAYVRCRVGLEQARAQRRVADSIWWSEFQGFNPYYGPYGYGYGYGLYSDPFLYGLPYRPYSPFARRRFYYDPYF